MGRLTLAGCGYAPVERLGASRVYTGAGALDILDLYRALKKYEDTGLTPEEIMDGKAFSGWIPVAERLPGLHTDVFVAVTDVGEDDPSTFIDCLVESDSGKLMWSTFNGALEKVLAWMPLPESYKPGN